MSQHVILVHGLWYRGLAMTRLARHLRAAGFNCHLFNYKTRSDPVRVLAERLHRFITALELKTAHILAHSLGGIVVSEMLSRGLSLPPGRVVLLGSPINGSKVATRLISGAPGRLLLGNSGALLANGCDYPVTSRETGMIAGNLPFGLGRALQSFNESNDGTVAVSETRVETGMAHAELPVSHTGLLFSAAVAEQVICFFKSGQFAIKNDHE